MKYGLIEALEAVLPLARVMVDKFHVIADSDGDGTKIEE